MLPTVSADVTSETDACAPYKAPASRALFAREAGIFCSSLTS